MTKILMLLAQSDIDTDPRASKAYKTAIDNGYTVKVCCYKRYDVSTYTANVDRIRMLFAGNINTYKKSKSSLFTIIASTIIMFTIHQIDLFIRTKKYRPDIMHANDLNTLLTGVLHKWFNKSKLIYDSHELWVDMMYTGYPHIRKILILYEQFLIGCVDEVITVNDLIANEFARRYDIKYPTVVMNVPYFTEVSHIPHNGIRVIYQGRYEANRHLEDVVRGAQHFYPGITLTMRGFGDHERVLRECVVSNNVEFIPPVEMEDLVQSLVGFDIGVATGASSQGKNGEFASPNKLFEYMMAGCAVVGNDSSFIVKTLKESGSGFTFKSGSPESFAGCVNTIVHCSGLLDRMKLHGKDYVRKRYCWEIEQKKLLSVYRKCEQSI